MHIKYYDNEYRLAITWLSMIIPLSVRGLKAWCMNAERGLDAAGSTMVWYHVYVVYI